MKDVLIFIEEKFLQDVQFWRADFGAAPQLTERLKKGKTLNKSHWWPIRPELISVSVAWSLGVLVLPPGWDASPSQGYPPALSSPGTHLYTWVESGTVTVKCLAQ